MQVTGQQNSGCELTNLARGDGRLAAVDVLLAHIGARVVDRVILHVHAVCGQTRCRWQRKWVEFGRKGFVWDLCVKGKRGGGGGRGRGAYSRRGSSSARSRSTYGSRHCGRTARG